EREVFVRGGKYGGGGGSKTRGETVTEVDTRSASVQNFWGGEAVRRASMRHRGWSSSLTSPRRWQRGGGGGGNDHRRAGRRSAAWTSYSPARLPRGSSSISTMMTTTTTSGATNLARWRSRGPVPMGGVGGKASNFATTNNGPKGGEQVDELLASSMSSHVDRLHSFAIGTIAGLLGSLAGMGGGFVMIPMMTAARRSKSSSSSSSWWRRTGGGLGLNQHQAHGTSLFAVGTTGLAGAAGYGVRGAAGDDDDEGESSVAADDDGGNDVDAHATTAAMTTTMEGSSSQRSTTSTSTSASASSSSSSGGRSSVVDLDAALALAVSAAITARFGAVASSRLSARTLQRALGAYMIVVAPLVPARAYLIPSRDDYAIDGGPPVDGDDGRTPTPPPTLERLLPISLVGIFSGFLSGMFGVGGGTVVVPSLVLATDMPYHSALGTSLCAMVLPAAVGTYTNARLGNVNWRVAPFLAAGSAAGAFVGAREVGLNVDEGVLKMGFSCLMLVLGVRTWRKGSR
ncbi:hypothetical protein ACHAW5_010220, partial [Stephanodiscus triporus]